MKSHCGATLLIVGACILVGLTDQAIHAQALSKSSVGSQSDDWIFMDNGMLRLGALRSSGGAIAFLAESGSTRNLLNHFDRGRLIQQSYYGDSDGSFWHTRPWRYNPVQGGDYRGKSSRLLELRAESSSLYARSIPLHWLRERNCRNAKWNSGSLWKRTWCMPVLK